MHCEPVERIIPSPPSRAKRDSVAAMQRNELKGSGGSHSCVTEQAPYSPKRSPEPTERKKNHPEEHNQVRRTAGLRAEMLLPLLLLLLLLLLLILSTRTRTGTGASTSATAGPSTSTSTSTNTSTGTKYYK